MNMKHKRLTFDGVNDLYQHPLYGARTLADIERMNVLACAPKPTPKIQYSYVECSTELYLRHERCIEENGFGMFGD
jgi:hypothetical protein